MFLKRSRSHIGRQVSSPLGESCPSLLILRRSWATLPSTRVFRFTTLPTAPISTAGELSAPRPCPPPRSQRPGSCTTLCRCHPRCPTCPVPLTDAAPDISTRECHSTADIVAMDVNGRFQIQLADGELISVKPCKLKPLPLPLSNVRTARTALPRPSRSAPRRSTAQRLFQARRVYARLNRGQGEHRGPRDELVRYTRPPNAECRARFRSAPLPPCPGSGARHCGSRRRGLRAASRAPSSAPRRSSRSATPTSPSSARARGPRRSAWPPPWGKSGARRTPCPARPASARRW